MVNRQRHFMAGAWHYVGGPSVHMYKCRLLIGIPNGLNKIPREVSQQAKRMLKDFLCKMAGPERQSGLVLCPCGRLGSNLNIDPCFYMAGNKSLDPLWLLCEP